jgi:hypothetical protein
MDIDQVEFLCRCAEDCLDYVEDDNIRDRLIFALSDVRTMLAQEELVLEMEAEDEWDSGERDGFLSDTEADANVLASIGWGVDEDYRV